MFKKKETHPNTYDKTKKRPVIRASICTGEQAAGFKDLATDKFTEIMLIHNEKDLLQFCRDYGIERSEIKKEY